MNTVRRTATWAAVLLTLSACHRTPPVATAPAPAADSPVLVRRADSTVTRTPPITDAMRRQAHADSVRRQVQDDADLAPVNAARQQAITGRIYFDYDQWDLGADDIERLETKRQEMAADPALTIRIAGNCDERGPDEYNLALGLRRAAVAKQWLVAHGIAAERIAIVSWGEENPVDQAHNEAAWAANRRDDFIVTGRDR